ncbi:hypothetical protein LINPERHAP1_LOCUS30223 [Linum perenne]
MLECASPAEVRRILALDRRSFGSFVLLLGPWTTMAGRSRVAWDANIAWMEVKGIPLHLRSTELARCVGEVCGDYLEMAEGNDLSSFRVKVKIRGELPEVIPLSVGSEIFPVKVVPSLSFPWKCPGPKVCSNSSSKGKAIVGIQKEIISEGLELMGAGDPAAPMMLRGESSGYGGSTSLQASTFSMVTERETSSEQVMRQQVFGLSKVQSQICSGGAVGDGISRDLSGKVDKVAFEKYSFLGPRLTHSGLRLGNFKLVFDSGLSGISSWIGVWSDPGFNDAFGFGPRGPQSGSGKISLHAQPGGLARDLVSGPATAAPMFTLPTLSLLSKEGLESQEERWWNRRCDEQVQPNNYQAQELG